MSDNTTIIASDLDEVAGKLSRACEGCKIKKKRCPHRQVIETADTTVAVAAVTASKARRRQRNETQLEARGDQKFSTISKNGTKQAAVEHSQGNPASSLSSDDAASLSSIDTDKDEKEKPLQARPKRGRPYKHIARPKKRRIPDHPEGSLEGSAAMSLHSVFGRELEDRLNDFDFTFQLSQQAHKSTLTAANAVKKTLDRWMDAWTAGK